MKVYVTQYALTDGVTIENVVQDKDYPRMVTKSGENMRISIFQPHWHETREEAVKRVDLMIWKKIRSLEKQLQKLQALDPEKMVPQEEETK